MSAPIGDLTPVRDAFTSIPSAVKFLSSIVALVVGWGLLSVSQGDAITGLLGAVPGVAALIGDLLREFRVAKAVTEAEALVTPVADPKIEVDGQLVPLVPADDYGRHAA